MERSGPETRPSVCVDRSIFKNEKTPDPSAPRSYLVKTAEAGPRKHSSSPLQRVGSFRSLFLESTMNAIPVVITNVVSQQPLQMRWVDSNHMVHQFAAATANLPLGHSVSPRTTCSRPRHQRLAHPHTVLPLLQSNHWETVFVFHISMPRLLRQDSLEQPKRLSGEKRQRRWPYSHCDLSGGSNIWNSRRTE
jgi:hypothetical protein